MKNFIKLGVAISLVLFSASVVSAADFKDVPPSHPNYKAIMELKTRGIIAGYSDGTFKPDQAVNRVESLKIILGASNIAVDENVAMGLAGFSDVDSSQWYAKYLNKALSLQIVQGYSDGTFKPTQTVNLVENLKMLLKSRKVDLSNIVVAENPYSDALKTEWYAPFVQYGKMANLLQPDVNNKIYPAQGMTRAKLAEVAYRLIYMQENQLDMFPPQNPVTPVVTDTTIVVPPITDPNLMPDTPNQLVMKVNIKNMSFSIANMTVGVGTKVVWINGDSMSHSVVSDSGNEINSGLLANGATYSHVFNSVGIYTYHCGVHPSMKATITVKPAIEVPTI